MRGCAWTLLRGSAKCCCEAVHSLPAMQNLDTAIRLAVALAIGLLMGLERGWEFRELPEGHRVAGLRTFGLISLLGAITVLVSSFSAWVLAAVAAPLGLALALGYWRESESKQDISLTTTVAGLLTFGLGAMAGEGQLTLAAGIAVVVALLLSFKPELHHLVRLIARQELHATFRLLLISVVLLPILPNRGFGPWQAVNPYRIWWLVVLIAAISYVGYFGIKLLGAGKGTLVTGLLGGLVSSTAVTANFARLGKSEPENQGLLAAGIAVASGIMFPRMLILVAAVAPNLLAPLLWPLLSAGAVAFAAAGWEAWRSSPVTTGHELQPRNPLDLRFALKFGLMLALIMFAARAASAWVGDRGLYAVAGLSGLIDVDSMTLSVATMQHEHLITMPAAVIAILLPAGVNTAIKPVLTAAVGANKMGLRVGLLLSAALAAGSLALLI